MWHLWHQFYIEKYFEKTLSKNSWNIEKPSFGYSNTLNSHILSINEEKKPSTFQYISH